MFWKMTFFLLTTMCTSLSAVSYQPDEIQAKRPLDAAKLTADPFEQFQLWYQNAKKELGTKKADIAILSTATKDGVPSARAMSINNIDQNDISFFGDLRSRKFQNLKENPKAAITFNWIDLQKQVRISGKVIPIATQEAHEAFNKRNKMSQISSLASKQSAKIDSHQKLLDMHAALVEKHGDSPVAKPDHWGGYRLAPQKIEFWQAGAHSLHSRVVYEKKGNRWVKTTLSP